MHLPFRPGNRSPSTTNFVLVVVLLVVSTKARDGKEPSLLEFGSVRVLPNIRVRSVRVLSSYGKMKVRFWFGSLCTVSGSVRSGSVRVLIHIYFSLNVYKIYIE